MRNKIDLQKRPPEREEQLREIENIAGVENLAPLLEYLTANPEIPVGEMGEKVRNGVLLALLTEIARQKDQKSICDLINYLLGQRRLAQAAAKMEEAAKPAPAEPEPELSEAETDEPETDEPFVEEITSDISREVAEAVFNFLDEEWPSFHKDT